MGLKWIVFNLFDRSVGMRDFPNLRGVGVIIMFSMSMMRAPDVHDSTLG